MNYVLKDTNVGARASSFSGMAGYEQRLIRYDLSLNQTAPYPNQVKERNVLGAKAECHNNNNSIGHQ